MESKNNQEPNDLIVKKFQPFQNFVKSQAFGGVLLLICALLAIYLANSPWREAVDHFWHTPISFQIGNYQLEESLAHWINDGLMVIFFFVVGLEIKREFMVGELKSFRQAALPIVAAIGGMVVPALVYTSFNLGTPGEAGWGIPMATDIAFALGILMLLGNKAPIGLKVFLTALAIVDDLGAVVVIALFYTADLNLMALGAAGIILLILIIGNRFNIRWKFFYLVLGILLWLSFLESGVHATVAGVILALTIPAKNEMKGNAFAKQMKVLLNQFVEVCKPGVTTINSHRLSATVQSMELACIKVESPMLRLEHALNPWILYFIMPVFALANAGVHFEGDFNQTLLEPVAVGIMAGLVIGKSIGITLFSWISIRSGMAVLPQHVSWRQIAGTSFLGGIGFTMSLFISNLAFGESLSLMHAKIGIIFGSLIAGIIGVWILSSHKSTNGNPQPAAVNNN